jgi:hypothetical protein
MKNSNGRVCKKTFENNLKQSSSLAENIKIILWRIVLGIHIYIRYTCLANYGASEAVNMCSRYLEKSIKCSEQKCASYLGE